MRISVPRRLLGWADGSVDGALAFVRRLADPGITTHPRYRAWERHHMLVAVRAGSLALAGVQLVDIAVMAPAKPAVLVFDVPTAIVALLLVLALRQSGQARRNPTAGALLLGLVAVMSSLLPSGFLPDYQRLMLGYMPIIIVASAVFLPWSERHHTVWLLLCVGATVAFPASPFAPALRPDDGQQILDVVLLSVIVSFAGHIVVGRQRRSMFQQRMQVRALNQVAQAQQVELRTLAGKLEAAARRDQLTGVGNRLSLDEEVARLTRAMARTKTAAAAIMLDLDHFKDYNDRHGHLAGDETLRRVAATIGTRIRPGDSVYRFGGEEFIVLLPETPLADASAAAERLRAAVEDLAIGHQANPPWDVVTISAGVAPIETGQADPDEWLRLADSGLYASKDGGRNRVTIVPSPHESSKTGAAEASRAGAAVA